MHSIQHALTFPSLTFKLYLWKVTKNILYIIAFKDTVGISIQYLAGQRCTNRRTLQSRSPLDFLCLQSLLRSRYRQFYVLKTQMIDFYGHVKRSIFLGIDRYPCACLKFIRWVLGSGCAPNRTKLYHSSVKLLSSQFRIGGSSHGSSRGWSQPSFFFSSLDELPFVAPQLLINFRPVVNIMLELWSLPKRLLSRLFNIKGNVQQEMTTTRKIIKLLL